MSNPTLPFVVMEACAKAHLTCFMLCIENGVHDSVIGQQAHGAIENALKALLEAHGATYNSTQDLRELVGNVRKADEAMQDFSLEIRAEIYTEYAATLRHPEQRKQPLLTGQTEYERLTIDCVGRILDRVQEVTSGQQRVMDATEHRSR